MFNYAQLDERDYCIGISTLSGEVLQDDMILIDEEDMSYIRRKYDRAQNRWTDEYFIPDPIEPIISEHELITKEISYSVEITSDDNLINMDMLLTIDEKLNAIMEHLGL